ncbi:MAG: hypothetical protein IT581_21010 [Verrucomicrobiales bacterium]|nr:hypothetical protein [Verrucomicrobiales bacterium]
MGAAASLVVWFLLFVLSPNARAASPLFTLDGARWRAVDVKNPAAARRAWDEMHLASALQGLVNRDAPRFYLFLCAEWGVETDRFWWDWMRGEGGWLRDREVRNLGGISEALEVFGEAYDGLVVYDEHVPATSALASTAAGVERSLPIRYDASPDSLFTELVRRRGMPVRLWLVNEDGTSKFTGPSAKNAAYRWARERWLGDASPSCGAFGAYYLDAYWLRKPESAGIEMNTLANHDWFIARRAFFFDLSPWSDEAPVDEPGQPVGEDRATLLSILGRLRGRAGGGIVKIGGFPPWPFKYTTHARAGRHEPVSTEWEFTRLISQYDAYHEADAAGLGGMANASFFAHYPLASAYRQPNARLTEKEWRSRGWLTESGRVAPRFFVGHYVGDYDAPSWLYKSVPKFFQDPARGQVPLGWAFDPNLADRAPQALVYAYQHATTNDYFIAGDSGAGYLNARALTVRPESQLESGLDGWTRYCQTMLGRWDMTITGFVLDGSAGASTDLEYAAYRRFSPDGLGTHFEKGPGMRAGVPTCPERDLPDGEADAARVIADLARRSMGRPGFLWARSILKSPSWYASVSRRLREEHGDLPVEVVDPYSFFGLIRREFDRADAGIPR